MYYRSITVIGLACVIAHANADVNDVNSMLTESGLVKVQDITPDVQLDLRYATTNNFTGRQIYDKAECYLRKPVADALACVQQELKKHDLGIRCVSSSVSSVEVMEHICY